MDAFLAAALRISRRESQRLLARGLVTLDGRRLAASAKGRLLSGTERLEVRGFVSPEARRPAPAPEVALAVLAEGAGWIALAKPAGVPVHPLEPDEGGTLLGALASCRPEVLGVGEAGLRSGVVHRLDVDTSGVVVFALDAACWQRLRSAFAESRVAKRYRALVHGGLRGAGELELELEVARHRPAHVRVRSEPTHGSRTTRLRWRALAEGRGVTLVEVAPRTGFLHQIRASLAHLGHPVVGDRSYGAAAPDSAVPRQMLHAAALRFEEIAVEAPDPADFAHGLIHYGVAERASDPVRT